MNNRYARQVAFKYIGEHGQKMLEQSTVTIIGCGALGTVCSELLVRAGVGEIHLADRDYVEYSNLQRQQLFTEKDAADCVPKVMAAKKRLQSIQSRVKINTYFQHVDANLMKRLAKKSNLIIDATDNFETRFIMNDVSFKYKIPWIYGACIESSGVVFPFIPGETPCLRCVLQTVPPLNDTCETVGVIAPAVQITAATQVSETLKILTGNISSVASKMHHFDLWTNRHIHLGIHRIKNCTCTSCGTNPTYPSLSINEQMRVAVLCGGETLQILPDKNRRITLKDAEMAANRLQSAYKKNPYLIQFSFGKYRIVVFYDGRILIHGLVDKVVGRKLYNSIFG